MRDGCLPFPSRRDGTKAVSPVVGTVILVAIVVVLVGISSSMFLELADDQTPAPTAALSVEPAPDSHHFRLVHQSGDTLDGDRFEIDGIADPNALAGRDLTASDSVTVHAFREEIRLIWTSDDETYTTHTLEVVNPGPPVSPATPGFSAGSVFTGTASGIISVDGDGGSVSTIPNTDNVEATGPPGPDVTGDGAADVPYVTSAGTIEAVNADGEREVIADSSAISGSIETSKTRLASGDWDGSPDSVFFVNQNHDTLYRATPSGSPQVVATPGDGVQAVVGIDDVDGDGTDELVFADGSQQLRYVETSGSITNVNNGQTGSNNGIGAGSLADVNGDGVPAIVGIDGSNDLKINREPSGDGTAIISGVDAAKAPVTVADVDGDSNNEVVYVGASSHRLKYVDDPLGTHSIEYLNDEDGNQVGASDETGAV